MAFGIPSAQFDAPWPLKSWAVAVFGWFQSITGIASPTSGYGVTGDVFWVRGDATDGAFNVTLPLASTCKGRRIGGIKTDASGNAVTFVASGADSVNGTAAISSQWDAAVFISDGVSNWDRIT